MISFRWEPNCEPFYQTLFSAGADLVSRESKMILKGETVLLPTGVWIKDILWKGDQEGLMPEIQVRARSGLALKHGLILTNGVGTVDIDYPGEISVIMTNLGQKDYEVQKGERIAQLVLAMTRRVPGLMVKSQERAGGFGSTGAK